MESTWEPRDLPVLDTVVRYFQEHPYTPQMPNVRTFAEITGLDVGQVYQAVRDLSPTYLSIDDWQMDDLGALEITSVTDEARRAVGQWPSPELWADRIIRGLQEAAEREQDPAKKSRLRATADGLASFGRDVLVGVLSGGINRGMES